VYKVDAVLTNLEGVIGWMKIYVRLLQVSGEPNFVLIRAESVPQNFTAKHNLSSFKKAQTGLLLVRR
jgi:hypothetical protein